MLFTDVYRTISSRGEGQFKEKGSRFIGLAFPVASENEVKELLMQMKKEYHDARHHCFAYILGADKAAFRINDDGEPSGSAGRPIYNMLLSNDLTNIVVVVVRYFGGVKLGIPGLINAYKNATLEALNSTQIVEMIVYEVYRINFSYLVMNEVMRVVKEHALVVVRSDFDLNCALEVLIRKSDALKITTSFMKIEGVKTQFLHNR